MALWVDPAKGDQGVAGALRVIPGDPMMSVMWLRMNADPDSLDQTSRHGRRPTRRNRNGSLQIVWPARA